ncbi:Hypothetical predicted protein [Octopus vulgaris]|uniref:Uncharacterized protein n=1 Tax=Octopus vulgaris TaxID=6645 RepID=A0AA36B8V3_OCTVU|nr:Hypothetical predicted protein [Octopus vulgaris]
MARGRPAARQFIVPKLEVLNPESILEESWNITRLSKAEDKILQWLARRRLIMNMQIWENCNSLCGLTTCGDSMNVKTYVSQGLTISKFGTAKSEIDNPDSNEIDREPVQ